MPDVRAWLSSLTAAEFDIFKIVLEKLLLAGIVAMVGAIFVILLERYKSALKKQEELSKFIMPRIAGMLDNADALYQQGSDALRALVAEFESFQDWADAIHKDLTQIEQIDINHVRLLLKGPDDLKFTLRHREKGIISIMDLLENAAPDDRVKDVLHQADFLKQKAHYEPGGLLFHLHLQLMMPPTERNETNRTALIIGVCSSVFVPMVTTPRKKFSENVNEFLLAMMRELPVENRRQKRAYGHILKMIGIMREIIDRFPTTLEVVRVEGMTEISTAQLLTRTHAAVVSQLRYILNTV